ncbi:hypothetical protein CH274_14680 [Rhodococcus sp. 06-418-5]|nr:hypothetical protein CH274_14680 [Rhodococcus sp. 06-418-5]
MVKSDQNIFLNGPVKAVNNVEVAAIGGSTGSPNRLSMAVLGVPPISDITRSAIEALEVLQPFSHLCTRSVGEHGDSITGEHLESGLDRGYAL